MAEDKLEVKVFILNSSISSTISTKETWEGWAELAATQAKVRAKIDSSDIRYSKISHGYDVYLIHVGDIPVKELEKLIKENPKSQVYQLTAATLTPEGVIDSLKRTFEIYKHQNPTQQKL